MRPFTGRVWLIIALMALAALPLSLGGAAPRPSQVSQTGSGLVASDPLDSTLSQAQLSNSSFWLFGGDAVGEGAPYDFGENSSGLNIGVRATSDGQYAGLYALHRDNATVAHAVITAGSRTVPGGYPSAGLYVQTGGRDVDYVECVAVTSTEGTYWGVAMTTGTPYGVTSYQQLWVDRSANQPLTRACTVITNGRNYLAVYVDKARVYENRTLNLGYQMPLQFFLETQTSYSGASYSGSFKDFYLTSNDSVTVENAPPGDTAVVTDSSGNVLASSLTGPKGVAEINVGAYPLPLTGRVEVYDSADNLISSTASSTSVYGGDVYIVTGSSYSGAEPPLAPSGLTATPTSPSQADLDWTAPRGDGGSALTGYSIQRSTDGGRSTTIVTNSTSTHYLDTGLSPGTTYSYRVSATNSLGTSPPSNVASATTSPSTTSTLTVDSELRDGTKLTGMFTTLEQGATQVKTGFTPAQFTTNKSQTYSVTVGNYGGYSFSYWLDDHSTNATRTLVQSTNTTLTAVYCDGPCSPPPPPPGWSVISVTTVDSLGQQISGYYITLWQNGTQIGHCFSECSFMVANGASYQVGADGYGSENFAYWQNDGSTGLETFIVPSSSATIELTAVYT